MNFRIFLFLTFIPIYLSFICGRQGNFTQTYKQASGPSNDIYGGCYALKGEYPWQALLWLTSNTGKSYICGATLISDEFLLTTATCVT